MTYGQFLKRNAAGTLCFRAVLPKDVRPVLGRTEITASLGNISKREASIAASALALLVKRAIRNARLGMSDPESLRRLLDLVHERKVKGMADETSELEAELRLKEELLEKLRAKHEGTTAALLAHQQAHSTTSSASQTRVPQPIVSPPPAEGSSATVKEAINVFVDEMSSGGKWKGKTLAKRISEFGRLKESLGEDTKTSSLRRQHVTEFRDLLVRLPKNANKIDELKGLHLRELATKTGYEVLNGNTVNLYLETTAHFVKWLKTDVQRWGVVSDIAHGLALSDVPQSERKTFDDNALTALFSTVEWQKRQFLHPYYYWLPLLAAYSGARIEELTQIRLEDFKCVSGVDAVALCPPGLQGKTESATRLLPIHSRLMHLGLLRYVEKLRSDGKTRLFPELKEINGKYSEGPSKWFGKLKRRANLDKTLVFHSWRHTVISRLLNAQLDNETIVKPLVGHRGATMTTQVYFHSALPLLKEGVEHLSYPVIDSLAPPYEQVAIGVDPHRTQRKPPSRRKASV
jgi:integrase